MAEAQPHRAVLPGRRLVGDLDGELQLVAFAEEPRRIGLDHEVLGGDRFVGQQAAAEFGVVGEAQELPLGQGLRHGEFELHLALGVGEQVGEEEGRFVEVLACRDLAQIGPRSGLAAAGLRRLSCRLLACPCLRVSASWFPVRRGIGLRRHDRPAASSASTALRRLATARGRRRGSHGSHGIAAAQHHPAFTLAIRRQSTHIPTGPP